MSIRHLAIILLLAGAGLCGGCDAGSSMRADIVTAAWAMRDVPMPMAANSPDETRRREAEFNQAAAGYDRLRDEATDQGVLVFSDLPVGSDRERFLAAFDTALTAREIPLAMHGDGGEDVSYARITDGVGGPVIALRIWSFPDRHQQVVRQVRNAIDARW